MRGAASSGSVTAAVDDEELELGLSLGANKASARGCRILTAGDFPGLAPRLSQPPPASPSASSSSVSSSSAAGGTRPDDDAPSRRAAGNVSSQVQVVGWPPIRAFRMNSLFHHSKDNADAADKKSCGDAREEAKEQKTQGRKKARSLFVKVNMDGDPIGRKVDLAAHHSYQGLASALQLMFHGPPMPSPSAASSRHGIQSLKLLDGSSEYKLTYEDKDGDWMLVGDVPWGMFLDNVKRLRIMRTADIGGGLASRVPSTNKFGGLMAS